MKSQLAILTLLVACLICSVYGASYLEKVRNANFNQFLRITVGNFAEAADDPISIGGSLSLPINISNAFVVVQGEISNVEYSGLSRMVEENIYSDVAGQSYHIRTLLVEPLMSGTYNLSGSIAASIPISAAGQFSLTAEEEAGPGRLEIACRFAAPQGYVILDNEGYSLGFYFSWYDDYLSADFAGLFDSSVDVEVRKEVSVVIGKEIRDQVKPFLTDILRSKSFEYFQTAFDSTSLIEIISGATPPPNPDPSSTPPMCVQTY